ncbi:MAG TPA: hypothetical protein DF613_02160 [Lachnospiraceae bacterium]|nr:hypothetical protein [Lachnospiraceae bacterium]
MDFDMNAANIAMLENYVKAARPMEEMFSAKGKTAIVTGGTSGLGFNIALRLLQGGANVVLAGSSDAKGAYTLPILEKAGYGPDRVIFCRTNVLQEEDMKALVNTADEKFGSIDIFINSAAVWNYAHIYDLPVEEFRRVMDTNVSGAFLGIKHISRYMIDHRIKGKITLISSNCAWLPYPVFGGYAHYAASKGGVNSLAIEAAKELKRFDIMVNVVAPGGMVTAGASSNMCVKELPEEKQEEFYDELMVWQTDEVPPVDTVAIVAYAMSTPMSDGMTGEIVVADSGMSHNIVKRQVAIEEYPENPEE